MPDLQLHDADDHDAGMCTRSVARARSSRRAQQKPRVRDRFQRSDPSPQGAGPGASVGVARDARIPPADAAHLEASRRVVDVAAVATDNGTR